MLKQISVDALEPAFSCSGYTISKPDIIWLCSVSGAVCCKFGIMQKKKKKKTSEKMSQNSDLDVKSSLLFFN